MAMLNNQMVSLYGISSMVVDDFRWFLMICVSLFYEGLCFEVGQHQQGSSDLGPRSWQSHGPLSCVGKEQASVFECRQLVISTYRYIFTLFIYLFVYLFMLIGFVFAVLVVDVN